MLDLGSNRYSTHSDELRAEFRQFEEHVKTFSSLKRKPPKSDREMVRRFSNINTELARLFREYHNGEDAISSYVWGFCLEDGTKLSERAARPLSPGDTVFTSVPSALGGTHPAECEFICCVIDKEAMRGWNVVRVKPQFTVSGPATVSDMEAI